MAADKQLIIVVEGTAHVGHYWPAIVSDYLEKIIKSFCGSEIPGQKLSSPTGTAQSFEFGLVMFNTHGPFSGCVLQRSSWTRDVDSYLGWLSSLTFAGGGLENVAIAEGLSEALMMFAIPQNGAQTSKNLDGKRHCILVAASNPFQLPTPVYRPRIDNLDQTENVEEPSKHIYDAETVAKWFSQCNVSLSVICPRQLQKLRALYNAAKPNSRGVDPSVDVKQSQFLVLIAENFMEARVAISRTGLAANQKPVASLPSASVAASSLLPVNGSVVNRPPISVGSIPEATVKVEPSTVTSMVSPPTLPHAPPASRVSQPIPSLQTSSPPIVSQEMITSNETQEVKPMVSLPQTVRPVGAILNHISQARVMNSPALTSGTSLGLQSMGGNPIGMHMSSMVSSGMASSMAPNQAVLASGQSGIATVSGSGPVTGTSQPMQNPAPSSFTAAPPSLPGSSSMPMSQPLNNLTGSGGMSQPVSSQGNVSLIAQSGTGLNPNMMSNLNTSVASTNNGTMMPTPGMSQPMQPGMQTVPLSNAPANVPLTQHGTAQQSKYVKVWEGNLSGQRQGQPVFITRLEGYRNSSASESLAANWPSTMQIVRLISQDHMNNKQYVGKADFLVFRAMNQHGFLQQLQEKKLCAVIQLPSQTLLLSVSDKACRLIGMLFPGDMVVFKPQISSQQQQQHNQQMQQQQHHQHQLLQQQLQQQQLQQLQQQQQSHPQMQQQQPIQQLQQQQPIQQMQQQQPMQQMQQQQPMQQMQQQQPMQKMQQQQPIQQMQQQQQNQPIQQQQPLAQMQQSSSIQQQQMQPIQQQLSQMQQHQQQQMPQMQQPSQQQIPQMQQQQQQPPQQQLPQLQQPQQLSQLQQPSQPQQMVGSGIGQAYVQGPGRPQLVSQGQVPSQGPQNMSGGGFMN